MNGLNYRQPHDWLIVVKRHVSERVDMDQHRVMGRLVACWSRLKLLPQITADKRAGVIADDHYSWFVLFTDRLSERHQDKHCVFVVDVRPSQEHDFFHLPLADRPVPLTAEPR
jgi:hypothetical protein